MTYFFIPSIVYPELNLKGFIEFEDFKNKFKKNALKITATRLMFESNIVISDLTVTKNRYGPDGEKIDSRTLYNWARAHDGFVVFKPTPTTIITIMQDKIDNIMDNFNFAKVEKAMQATGWRWCNVEGIPKESDLRKQARELLKQVSEKYVKESDFRYYVSTGGFKATKYFDGELELEFVMAEWQSGE